ncbi:hypothetical protein WA026_023230 [Henosepilachna vigintioctopunctata]|uniref:C2H2-type domain-containing protein n=1 Tax=Henosepilachna vigintioctopunctata TaxID=420089 RepID=A0AAW1VIA1_9CUCU
MCFITLLLRLFCCLYLYLIMYSLPEFFISGKKGMWPGHIHLPLLLKQGDVEKETFLSSLNIFAKNKQLNVSSKVSEKGAMKQIREEPSNSSAKKSQSPFCCPDCGRGYKLKSSLRNHVKWECGKEPQFTCPYCSYKAKQKMHVNRHIERMHKVIDYSAVKCESVKNDFTA